MCFTQDQQCKVFSSNNTINPCKEGFNEKKNWIGKIRFKYKIKITEKISLEDYNEQFHNKIHECVADFFGISKQ